MTETGGCCKGVAEVRATRPWTQPFQTRTSVQFFANSPPRKRCERGPFAVRGVGSIRRVRQVVYVTLALTDSHENQ